MSLPGREACPSWSAATCGPGTARSRLAWPGCANYGRLTAVLSRIRMQSGKGDGSIGREAMLAAPEGRALAVVPPAHIGPAFVERLQRDAAALHGLPLHVAASHSFLRTSFCTSASSRPFAV